MFEEGLKMYNTMKEMAKLLDEWDRSEASAMYAMVLEEYCKSKGLDILEVINEVHTAVIDVNNELGKY